MATLGERIRDLRESKDIPQKEFAKKIGISNVVLSRYESGDRKPDYEVLKKIADYFQVSTDWLLNHSVDNNQTIYGKNINLAELSEKQRIVLEWALNQDALSFHSEDEIYKILDRLSVVMEYERAKSGEDGNNKNQI